MPGFLTPEWVDAVNAALADIALGDDVTISVGHLVGQADGTQLGYVVRLVAGRASAAVGAADVVEAADVVFVHDAATAAGIHRGELLAQQAIEAGRLKVRGDTQALIARAAELSRLRDAIAGVGDG